MGMRIVPIYERLRTRKDRPSGLSIVNILYTTFYNVRIDNVYIYSRNPLLTTVFNALRRFL